MYTRIHVFKFPNKVGRDSFRFFCINYTDKLFKEGLNFSLFIDVSDTHLHYLTVWKSQKDWEISFKKAKESKLFIDPNLLLAEVCMKRYKK